MRYFYILFIGILVVSCNSEKPHSDLYFKAEFENVSNGTEIYIGELIQNKRTKPIDTVKVNKGKIIVDLPKIESPQIYVMDIAKPNSKERLFFVNENVPVHMKIYKDSLNSSTLESGELNAVLQDYMHKINEGEREYRKMQKSFPKAEQNTARVKKQLGIKQKELDNRNTMYRREFLAKQTENPVSLLVYSDLISTQTMTVSEMRRIYNTFSKDLKNTDFGKQLSKEFVKSDPLAIGNIAPSFSAPTPDGKELALEDALGKYTLIDFWAAWCMPCRVENPNLVRVHEKYKDKGFTILGVSLDRDRDKWLKAIEDDNLEWNQISNLKFWQDPIARQYRIRSIPASILLDEEGRIIAKNLRGKALEHRIKELLKDS